MDFINHLLSFSSSVISLELDKTSINKIIWLDETYCQEDYLDPYCDSFQINLINAKDSILARIIDNFDEAIKSKCGNDIDLSKYSDKDDWSYGFKSDHKQQNINKRYYDIELTPEDKKVFKEMWLRNYIIVLSKIISNIRTVTNNTKDVSIDNPYPLLFIDQEVYQNFKQYTSKCIIDYYLDYSYLKKRLEDKRLIHNTKDNEFMRVLYQEMKLISERDYKDYKIKDRLYSLNKSSSVARENNFNNIFLG